MRSAFLGLVALAGACGGTGVVATRRQPRLVQVQQVTQGPAPKACAPQDKAACEELNRQLQQVTGEAPEPRKSSILVPLIVGAVIVFAIWSLEVFAATR